MYTCFMYWYYLYYHFKGCCTSYCGLIELQQSLARPSLTFSTSDRDGFLFSLSDCHVTVAEGVQLMAPLMVEFVWQSSHSLQPLQAAVVEKLVYADRSFAHLYTKRALLLGNPLISWRTNRETQIETPARWR
jgi:hypothetical protein